MMMQRVMNEAMVDDAEPQPGEVDVRGASTLERDAKAVADSVIAGTAKRADGPVAKKADPRAARLAAALKANIGRRKAAALAAAGDDES